MCYLFYIIQSISEKNIPVNPAASLYEDITDEEDIKKYFNELGEYLKIKNIKLITIEDALLLKGKGDKVL